MLETIFRRVSGGPDGQIVPPSPSLAIEVIDGDTVKIDGVLCRLEGYDAPEIHKPRSPTHPDIERVRGEKAKRLLTDHINRAATKQVILSKARGGGFGRDLVQLLLNGKNIAHIAIEEGWARSWKKGQKIDWGDEAPLGRPFPD